MRRAFRALFVAGALAVAAAAEAGAPELPPPRIVELAPIGERVPLDTPLALKFDQDVPESARQNILVLDPPTAGEIRWLDPRSVVLEPRRWRMGRAERVRVQVPGADPVEWIFRTRVPMPTLVTPGEGTRLILSFDDGPKDRVQADRLLSTLRDLKIKALFFPSGRWAKQRPDWVARAVEDGHRVCNHTLNHVNLTAPWMTEARIRSEIAQGAGDGQCKLFRPPLMGFDKRVERVSKELGYELFLWDVDSRDWEGGPAEDVLATVLGMAKPEAVVLLHMHAENTLRILAPLAEELRRAGYVLSWDPLEALPRVAPDRHAEWAERLARPTDVAETLPDLEETL